ncbi:hypothetical protein RYX36_009019 [Vicia faba]
MVVVRKFKEAEITNNSLAYHDAYINMPSSFHVSKSKPSTRDCSPAKISMKIVDNCYDLIPKINSIHKNQFHFKKHKNKPGKRWGHTCNSINGGRHIYVFAGYGKDNCQTNQVHVFETVNQTWSQSEIKGSQPTARDNRTCSVIGHKLFSFGGTDGMNPLKDFHILDTSLQTWDSPVVRGQGPEAREGHSAAVVGKRPYIFGGCGKSADNNNEVYYNDLYMLNTETLVWMRPTTSGTPSSPCDNHTCSSWKNKIIVIGCEDGHDCYLSDVHILDTDL